jgi:hypothetical protein
MVSEGMTHTKSQVCRLAAGAFKRDAIPKSAGTVKKYTLFRESELYLKKYRDINFILFPTDRRHNLGPWGHQTSVCKKFYDISVHCENGNAAS